MGNYKFRLSDMIPNAWFYKLRDMSKSKNQNKKLSSQLPQNPRKSFYISPRNSKAFDTHFPAINIDHHHPRKSSSKLRSKRKTIYMPSPRKISISSSPDKIYLESLSSSEFEYNFCDDHTYNDHTHRSMNEGLSSEFEYSCSCKLSSSSATDIIFDMNEVSHEALKADVSAEFNMVSESPEPELGPILTKPTKRKTPKKSPTENRVKPKKKTGRKSIVKIRGNSPSKKSTVKGEKKGMFYCESLAIVKASYDPERDFRESMMEMIVENNIRASKDLEELLACYLSLNSNQYHEIIIKAFEQIWFNMPADV